MKFAAIATIAATSFALVAADAPCSDKLTTTLTAATANQAKCKTESGFDITAKAPTSDVLAKFCKSESCVTLWKTLKELGLSECMINDKEILTPAAAACPALAASSGATTTTTTAPSTKTPTASNSTTPSTKTPTTATPVSTTKAPTPTTKAPTASNATTPAASTTKAPTASNSTSSNSTAAKTPAATTKAPTPSTSGVSALSLSAGAVVLAVAASFF